MTPQNKGMLLLFCALFLLSVNRCSVQSLTGGSGTEVSAVFGSVLDSDGRPVEKALVRLRPAMFTIDSAKSASYLNSHSIFDTVTGSDGCFSFTKLQPGSYTVEVLYNDTLGSLRQLLVEDSTFRDTLTAMTIVPLANLSGNVSICYDTDVNVIIQTYGSDRFVNADTNGYFTLAVPCGLRNFHIAAYRTVDSIIFSEFDGIDISISLFPGEQRDAGSFFLRQPPPQPCIDGICDSSVISLILDSSGNDSVSVGSVIKTDAKGRVIELCLRGLDFSKGIAFDIIRLNQLRLLDIGNTDLHVIFPGIGTLANLETVMADNNNLFFFSSTAGGLEKLRRLDLSNNMLTELPQSIVNCHNLTDVDISGNRLCSQDSAMTTWSDIFDPDWRSNQHCQ